MNVALVIIVVVLLLMYNRREKMTNLNNTRYITLYAVDWCGYCKQLRPTWESLKTNLQSSNVVFKEVNGDVAKIPGMSYPTIIMLTERGDNIKYGGDRSYGDLQRWILDPTL